MKKKNNNHILIIDDNPNIHMDIKSVLTTASAEDNINDLESVLFNQTKKQKITYTKFNCTIDSAFSGEEGLEKISAATKTHKPYSLIFIDIRTPPGMNGIDATQKILELDPNVQIVICSAYSDHTWQKLISTLGVSDRWLILKKPFELIEMRQMACALCEKWSLQAQMHHKITEKTLFLNDANHQLSMKINELKKAHQKINYLAYFDSLTNLPNRNYFYTEVERLFQKAKENSQKVVLMYLDLDNFKHVNDAMGHSAGDALLCKVTEKLQKLLRDYDILEHFIPNKFVDINLARIGGDEFVIILNSIHSLEHINSIAERILSSVSVDYYIAGNIISVTASIGIAIYPNDGDSIDSLMKNADAAMYSAKNCKRNTFQFYSEKNNYETQERLQLDAELRKALSNEELFLCYQLKYKSSDRSVIGMEALLRWQHPRKGVLYPIDFIYIAEELDIIVPIGTWVLETACRDLKHLHDMGYENLMTSVNISSLQFKSPDLLITVERVLNTVDLAPHFLELELTERIIMIDQEEAPELLRKLKKFGVSISIDDFGTGYSSLSHLSKLPIDTVKIDRSFVSLIEKEKTSPILDSIIELSHNLQHKVIAEGVETEEEFEYLASKGCDEIQGFLLSKPLPFEELVKKLKNI